MPQLLTRPLNCADIHATLGNSAINAMVRAELKGSARCNGVTIVHVGYVEGASHFDASTATYNILT